MTVLKRQGEGSFERTIRLSFKGKKLSQLPHLFITHNPHLKELDLRDNNLSILEADLSSLTQLEVLKLDKNQLRELPESVYELKSL